MVLSGVIGSRRSKVLAATVIALVLVPTWMVVDHDSSDAAVFAASHDSIDDTAFTYGTGWQIGAGAGKYQAGDHYSAVTGASATVTFTGRRAAIYGAKAPHHGLATVRIDGLAMGTVDLYAATRADNTRWFLSPWLTEGEHRLEIVVTGGRNTASSGSVVAIDRLSVQRNLPPGASLPSLPPQPAPVVTRPATPTAAPTLPKPTPVATVKAPAATPAPVAAGFVRRTGSSLTLAGEPFRFAGANLYYLGLDDNLRDSSGAPTHPTKFRIDNALDAAVTMGSTVVRAHTLGISVGSPQSIEPSLGVFNDAAFDSIDYAIAGAQKRGLKLMIPLTDQWRWYHGGKSVFTGWRDYPNNPSASRNAANDEAQKVSEAHFYTDQRVIGDFQQYIAHVLNHRNAYTGVALKNDPTIAIWETGNEIWDAPPAWTETIAAFIKTLAPKQLVADGSAATGKHVADAAVNAPSVDILGGHFYPRDPAWLKADAAVAAAHGKAYVVGEYDWTGDVSSWLAQIEGDRNVAGGLMWTLLPRQENGQPEPHADGYEMWLPGTSESMRQAQQTLIAHARRMSGS